MSKQEITEQEAIQLYGSSNSAGKKLLKEKFGEDLFKEKTFSKIKTFEDACKKLKLNPAEELQYKLPKTSRQKYRNAAIKLEIIAEALLDGTILDWTSSSQNKYYPVFNNYKKGSGFRFHGSDCDWSRTFANGGARLCVQSKEVSDYFGTQFLAEWNDFLNPVF